MNEPAITNKSFQQLKRDFDSHLQKYFCPACFKIGELYYEQKDDILTVIDRIKKHHKKLSPDCENKVSDIMIQNKIIKDKNYCNNVINIWFTRGHRSTEYGDRKRAMCTCGLEVKSVEVVSLKDGAVILFKCPDPNCNRIFAKQYNLTTTWEVKDFPIKNYMLPVARQIIRGEI